MKLEDPALIAHFRLPGPCEYCRRPCPGGRDPHHIYSKGAGQVDITINLVSLCRGCHNGYHYTSKPSLNDLLLVVALREAIMPEDVFTEVSRIRNIDPKTMKPRREMP